MGTTADLGLPELAQAQAFPEITFNETIVLLQTLAASGVIDKDLTAPPVSPTEGDAYLINTATPTGAWALYPFCIAVYWGNAWRFLPGVNDAGTPIAMGSRQEGLRVWVRDENAAYVWRNTATSPASYDWVAAYDVPIAAALSVLGNPTAVAGEPVSIPSSVNNTFPQRIGGAIVWAGASDALFSDNTIALARLVSAAAQFDLIGRKTSGAGAWEDCTRSDLALARTDATNTFALAQIINSATSAALGVNITGGSCFTGTVTTTGSGININGDGVTATSTFTRYTTGAGGMNIAQRHARGSLAVPTILATNDQIGAFNFQPYDGATFITQASVTASMVDPAPAVGAMGSVVRIATTPNGSATISANAFSFGSDLGFQIGGTTAPFTVIDNARHLIRRQYTFATLPAAGTAGRCAAISDGAAVPVWLAAAAGGGAVKTPVYDNGAAWVNG